MKTLKGTIMHLKSEREKAREQFRENHKEDKDSFASGYETGFIDACTQTLNFILDNDEAN